MHLCSYALIIKLHLDISKLLVLLPFIMSRYYRYVIIRIFNVYLRYLFWWSLDQNNKLISLSLVFLFLSFVKNVAFFSSENVPRQKKEGERKKSESKKGSTQRCQRKKRPNTCSKILAVCEWRWMASTIKVRSLEKCWSVKARRSGATCAQICVAVK